MSLLDDILAMKKAAKESACNTMVYLDGSKTSFRCHCGCNVFHIDPEDKDIYICNGCQEKYRGED